MFRRRTADGIHRDEELTVRAQDEHAGYSITLYDASPCARPTSATTTAVDTHPIAVARDPEIVEPLRVSREQCVFLAYEDA